MKILIIGLGSIAKKHIDAIRAITNDIEIYALRSGVSNSDEYNVLNIFSFDEINFIPDFVIISNPTALHEQFIIKCLKFKCPLFIEKPSLSNLKNADTILSLIKSEKIITYVGCNLRFLQALIFFKANFLNSNLTINEVNIYCGSYLPNWRPQKDFKTLYSTNEILGGGVHLDLIHELDYCYWLFGLPKNLTSIKRSVSSLKIATIDYANYILQYDNFSVSIILNYYRLDMKREMEVVTSKNTILVDILTNSVFNKLTNELLFEHKDSVKETYISQMSYFIENKDKKIELMNNFEESLQVLKISLNE